VKAPALRSPRRALGLSAKLIGTILLVIVSVEALISMPTIANFRLSWLEDRLRVGLVASTVLDAVPDVLALPQTLTDRLLTQAGAIAIVYRRQGQSELLQLERVEIPREAVTIDLRVRDPVTLILGAFDTLVLGGDRALRIISNASGDEDSLVEVLMREGPLKRELVAYSLDILLISALISALTALAIYIFLARIVIGPIKRLSDNVQAFREAPENATRVVTPSGRRDEIGSLEQALGAMERDLFAMLRQRRHLADLGLAVAKINHDLRNTLTSAQLLSDQVATLDDPKVQRLAPRLVQTLDKAIGFAQSVLDYGRQSVVLPVPEPIPLKALIEEAAIEAGITGHPLVHMVDTVDPGLVVVVDPVQIGRVFTNLLRNSREALEAHAARGNGDGNGPPPVITVSAARDGNNAVATVSDNGPGLPPRAREHLFVAFEGSARAGGTGLGLAIARELVEAHGGELRYVEQPVGARFDVSLPASKP
jgi:signal transduction histidine kinase